MYNDSQDMMWDHRLSREWDEHYRDDEDELAEMRERARIQDEYDAKYPPLPYPKSDSDIPF